MRKIAIVGAGQAGLQLALGLLGRGYEVTLIASRTPAQVEAGRVLSSQFMFHDAVELERGLGLDEWQAACPATHGLSFTIPGPAEAAALSWQARFDDPGRSVDQRLKLATWMRRFGERGGRLVIADATPSDLEQLAGAHDLVIVAVGRGELGRIFARDEQRSAFSAPMRALALTYVRGMAPRESFSAISFSLVPGVGEIFTFPALTVGGACDIFVFEGVPGGPMDCWSDVRTPAEHLERTRSVLKAFAPLEARRCARLELTDPHGTLAGRFAPVVRRPVGRLPSGKPVLGVGDAVVTNDPITGQGANTAAKAAAIYLERILERGDAPFDEPWMQATFETFWTYAQWVVAWTNSLLVPPAPHVLRLMGAAAELPTIAARIAGAFNRPQDLAPWWFDEQAAEALLRSERLRSLQPIQLRSQA